MKTYCVAQGTLLRALWWPKWRETQTREDVCKYRVDSLCCRTEINKTW